MEVIRKKELIAKRMAEKGGDKWNLCTPEGLVIFEIPVWEFPSLTDVLEAYFQKYQYKGDFIISPSKGEIYILLDEMVEIPPPKKFNIYGDL
jgi:hypothetical protein